MSAAPGHEIDAFLARFSPGVEAELRAARKALRDLAPRGYELVYDNYNALVFAISATPRASGAVVSVAGYPRWVTLFFAEGASLEDPAGLLEGDGARIRGVRLAPFEKLASAPVRALLREAIAPHRDAFAAAPPLATVVKSVAARQRPRRPVG